MAVIDFIGQYGGWSWIVFGLVLLALELLAPGVFLIWLGAAALVTGLAALVSGIDWPIQWALFGILSLVFVAAWTGYQRRRYGKNLPSDSPLLNQRTTRYFGREVLLSEPISEGFGRVQIADTVWRVSGPDLPEGTTVRIVGAEGAVLRVEAVK